MRYYKYLHKLSDAKLAALFKVSAKTVAKWRKSGTIPDKYAKHLKKLKKPAKVPKFMAEIPADTLSGYFGVSIKAIDKWRKDGIPKKYSKAAKEIKKHIKPVPAKIRKKWLKSTNAFTLSALSGVSEEEAKKWIKKGDIPLDYRSFLVEAIEEKTAFERLIKEDVPREVTYQKLVKGKFHMDIEWDFSNVQLTDSNITFIISELGKFASEFPEKTWNQFYMVDAVGDLDFKSVLRYGYELVVFKEKPKEVKFEQLWFPAFYDFQDSLAELKERMVNELGRTFTFKKIGLKVIHRVNLETPPVGFKYKRRRNRE